MVREVYEQQKYMYDDHVHSVPDRIVSINQPYIRPIVRGKAKAPTEFDAKLDLSIDDNGMARIEKQSFDTYNESDVLIGAVDRIEIERRFSLAKRCYGLESIRTELDVTTRSSICLSVIAMNVAKLVTVTLRKFVKSVLRGTIPDIWYYMAYENGIQRLML